MIDSEAERPGLATPSTRIAPASDSIITLRPPVIPTYYGFRTMYFGWLLMFALFGAAA